MQEILQILTILLSGAAVAAIVFVLSNLVVRLDFKQRATRIVKKSWGPTESALSNKKNVRKIDYVAKFLSRLSVPDKDAQVSGAQNRFLQAGIRNKNAPQYYYAVKTLLTVALPVILGVFLYLTQPFPATYSMLLVVLTATAGYYLPEIFLHFITDARVSRMRESLPDMIDLMVVCTESGMAIDSAINRVSREMARAAPELSQEFYLAILEMRAGANRIEALRNLAMRSRLQDLKNLVAMFVQAEKFGTSMADSLRVHSEVMRTRRIQRAEEIAAKIPVKLTLPLGLFIFPTLIIVMLGPAGIQLFKTIGK